MARCQICGKGPAKGKKIIRTGTGKWIKKRVAVRRMPNLQRATILEKGKKRKIRVCTGCLKKLRKEGRLLGSESRGKGNLAKTKVE